jgi:hypothetical protein
MGVAAKRWGVAALAVGLSAGLGFGGAQAQDAPPGCVRTGNPDGAVAGALLGGVAGALLGNAVSGRHKAPGTIIGGVTGAAAGAAIGGGGQVRCPDGYAYQGPPPRAADVDYDESAPAASEGEFWYGAPPRIRERIGFLRRRIDRMDHEGWLSPRERDGLFHRLGDIQRREERIRDHNDGHLPPEARDHLEADLDDVAGKLRWEQYRTEHAERQ